MIPNWALSSVIHNAIIHVLLCFLCLGNNTLTLDLWKNNCWLLPMKTLCGTIWMLYLSLADIVYFKKIMLCEMSSADRIVHTLQPWNSHWSQWETCVPRVVFRGLYWLQLSGFDWSFQELYNSHVSMWEFWLSKE